MPNSNKALPFLIVVVFIIAVYANQSQVTQEQGIFSFLKGLFGKKEAKNTSPPLNQPIQTPSQTQPSIQSTQCQPTDDAVLLVRLSIAEQSNRQLYAENIKLKQWATLCKDYTPPKCPPQSTTITIGCSGSMRPFFDCRINPHVYLYKPSISDFLVCDVVVAKNPMSSAGTVFHRIVGINDSGGTRRYVLKGDANPDVDAYQPTFTEIEKKVCYE